MLRFKSEFAFDLHFLFSSLRFCIASFLRAHTHTRTHRYNSELLRNFCNFKLLFDLHKQWKKNKTKCFLTKILVACSYVAGAAVSIAVVVVNLFLCLFSYIYFCVCYFFSVSSISSSELSFSVLFYFKLNFVTIPFP